MGNTRTLGRLAAVLAVVAVAVTVYLVRPAAETPIPEEVGGEAVEAADLPRLLDLGADRCVPCKLMAPILDQLKTEFAADFRVEFIDVWKNPDAAKPYGVRVIPTQIFYATDGTELFRHEGFFGREEILAKWRELGVTIPEKGV